MLIYPQGLLRNSNASLQRIFKIPDKNYASSRINPIINYNFYLIGRLLAGRINKLRAMPRYEIVNGAQLSNLRFTHIKIHRQRFHWIFSYHRKEVTPLAYNGADTVMNFYPFPD